MGKLIGLPMGMAPCYTNHTSITQDDQEDGHRAAGHGGSQLLYGRSRGDDGMPLTRTPAFMTTPIPCGANPPAARTGIPQVDDEDGPDGRKNGILTARAGDGSIFLK